MNAVLELVPSPAAAVSRLPRNTLRVGVIGFGYWGPNVVRNLHTMPAATVAAVCDISTESLRRAAEHFPGLYLTSDPFEVLSSRSIDAVAIVTPVRTHFEMARAALQNGKHVFVEKPFTATVQQSEQLIDMAEQRGLTIMVDHTFLFTGVVRKIHQLIFSGSLGPLYYYDSMRVNLGVFQHDVNVIWDLAPHDLSLMDYLVTAKPEAISATGQCHFGSVEDVAFITLFFPERMIAHINVSWLSPVKIRTTLIGGERKMLVWNDLEADEKIKVYDRGVEISRREQVYELLVNYRSGDVWAPKVRQAEALKTELEYFVECVAERKTAINDGEAGLRVVKLLEAASRSLARRGELVRL